MSQGPAKPADAATAPPLQSLVSLWLGFSSCRTRPRGRGRHVAHQGGPKPADAATLPAQALLRAVALRLCPQLTANAAEPSSTHHATREASTALPAGSSAVPPVPTVTTVPAATAATATAKAQPPGAAIRGAPLSLGGDTGMAGGDGAAARMVVLGAAMPQGAVAPELLGVRRLTREKQSLSELEVGKQASYPFLLPFVLCL